MLCDFYVSQKTPLNIFPQGPHKEENLRSLLRQLMPALLRLACGSDLVAKQLFHLLVMQLMHWLSSRIMLATPQTEVALLAVWVRHLFYLIVVLLSTYGPNRTMQNIPLNSKPFWQVCLWVQEKGQKWPYNWQLMCIKNYQVS